MQLLNFFRSKITDVKQEITDAIAYLRRYDTEANRVFLAIVVCIGLFLLLSIADTVRNSSQQPTPPVQASTLLTL